MQNSDVGGQLSVEFFVMHVCVFVISTGVGEWGRGICVTIDGRIGGRLHYGLYMLRSLPLVN